MLGVDIYLQELQIAQARLLLGRLCSIDLDRLATCLQHLQRGGKKGYSVAESTWLHRACSTEGCRIIVTPVPAANE